MFFKQSSKTPSFLAQLFDAAVLSPFSSPLHFAASWLWLNLSTCSDDKYQGEAA